MSENKNRPSRDGQIINLLVGLIESNFERLGKNVDRLQNTVEVNNNDTRQIKNRLRKIETKVFPAETQAPWYTNQRLLYLALACIFIFLLIAAALTNTKVPNLNL